MEKREQAMVRTQEVVVDRVQERRSKDEGGHDLLRFSDPSLHLHPRC